MTRVRTPTVPAASGTIGPLEFEILDLDPDVAALALGVLPERISTVAAGAHAAGPDALMRITDAILADRITGPIAASFPIEQIRDAVTLQTGRHAHGKIVVRL
jgi:hypothetical protein